MKNLYITDDKSATDLRAVKMTCDCGWVKKALARDAIQRGTNHLKTRHGGGLMRCLDQVREVK